MNLLTGNHRDAPDRVKDSADTGGRGRSARDMSVGVAGSADGCGGLTRRGVAPFARALLNNLLASLEIFQVGIA